MDVVMEAGHERIVLDRAEYQDLVDARDHALAMQDIASGGPVLSEAELGEYLAAATPLAFWRKHAGKTQAVLAAEVGVSQPFLAQIETGKRDGSVGVLAKIARALRVRIEDLVAE